ncbi:hypothetical protein H7I57_30655, partial [Mycobacterium pyrenivorans]|nr:hypothetical protein [Mycolicibacterium pyrenivorans]
RAGPRRGQPRRARQRRHRGGQGLDGANPAARGSAATGNPNHLGSTGLPYSNTVVGAVLIGNAGGRGADGAAGTDQSGGHGGQGQGVAPWFSAPHDWIVSGDGGDGGDGAGGGAGGDGGNAGLAQGSSPRAAVFGGVGG